METAKPKRVAAICHPPAQLQTLALSRIMTSVLGTNRLPMIVIESADLIQDRRQFNARAAGLLGMINFGRNHFYAMDTNLELLLPELKDFLHRFGGEPFAQRVQQRFATVGVEALPVPPRRAARLPAMDVQGPLRTVRSGR